MDKLSKQELNETLTDVRKSYRLLALYQQRIKDTVKYIGNVYGMNFDSGWPKFSKTASRGRRVNIDDWSWDWLSMYFYEFNLGSKIIDAKSYHFKVLHQADTGYYDASVKLSMQSINEFGSANKAISRMFLILSREENGCPLKHLLNGKLSADSNVIIQNENWLAIPYELQQFMNQEGTDNLLKDFDIKVFQKFGVSLIVKSNEEEE